MTKVTDDYGNRATKGEYPEAATEVARQTYRWDMVRGSMQGIVEACWFTFALLVAIRVFDAPDMVKAILPGAYSLGLLMTPLLIYIVSRKGGTAGKLCAIFSGLSGLAMIAALSAPIMSVYVVFMVLAAAFVALMVPLLTKIYSSNYPTGERGSRVSTTMVLGALVGAGYAYGGGLLLDLDLQFYRIVFLGAGLALFVNIIAFQKMPSVAIRREPTAGAGRHFRHALRNRVFCVILVAWMFQGFGVQMTFPIRVEYLAHERYGINATNEDIGLIMGAIPLLSHILSAKVWGYLFDRLNFITLRIVMNLIGILSIFMVFFTSSLWVIGAGMGLYGVSLSGGRLLWQLWVVKVANPDQVPAYMGIHTSLTGVRGVLSPFVAYLLIGHTNPQLFGWIATVIIAIGIGLMLPLRSYFVGR